MDAVFSNISLSACLNEEYEAERVSYASSRVLLSQHVTCQPAVRGDPHELCGTQQGQATACFGQGREAVGAWAICSSCSWYIDPNPWSIFASFVAFVILCNFNVSNLISFSPEGLNAEDVMQGRMGAEQM